MTISNLFLPTGVIALIVGVCIGMWMGGTGHFEFRHAHAHTNLVGWASMMIYGVFYRLFPEAGGGVMAKVHAGLAIPALMLMIGGTLGNEAGSAPFLLVMIGGEFLMALGVVVFAIILFRATGRVRNA